MVVNVDNLSAYWQSRIHLVSVVHLNSEMLRATAETLLMG
jgi:hypothetical protein